MSEPQWPGWKRFAGWGMSECIECRDVLRTSGVEMTSMISFFLPRGPFDGLRAGSAQHVPTTEEEPAFVPQNTVWCGKRSCIRKIWWVRATFYYLRSPITRVSETDTIFWGLVEENRGHLWRFALGLTHSREEARDLASETVLAQYRSFRRLRDHSAFKKSLFTIAIRIHRRQRWRRRIFSEPEPAFEYSTEPAGESHYDLDLLMEALEQLPVQQREAVLLFEISGMSLEEVHAVQGGSLSGVKSRLKRAREALREILVDRENGVEEEPSTHSSRSFEMLS
jgi:RNA polymerase sigma-70 factor, ECF subfamily